MENIDIVKSNSKGHWPIAKIGRHTFLETFSGGSTEENMKRYLDDDFSLLSLTNTFSN